MSIQFLLLLSVLVSGGIIVSGCSFLIKDPEISVKEAGLSNLSLTDMTLDVTFSVKNPNPVGMTFKTIEFDVFYLNGGDWIFLSHGEQEGVVVKPGDNEVEIPVTVKNVELAKSLFGLITKREIEIKIQGEAAPDLLGISPKVPFEHKTTIYV